MLICFSERTVDHETKMPSAVNRFHRREVLGGVAVGVVTVGVGIISTSANNNATRSADDKRKARYRAESWEVQTFYRVNRYPGR